MIVAGCPVLPLETGAGGLFRGFSPALKSSRDRSIFPAQLSLCEPDRASNSCAGGGSCSGGISAFLQRGNPRRLGRLSDLRTPGALGQSFSRGEA